MPLGEFIYFVCVIGNCKWQCFSAQQSSRNVFGNSYVCAYSHLFSFVSFILLGASMVTQDIKVFKFNIVWTKTKIHTCHLYIWLSRFIHWKSLVDELWMNSNRIDINFHLSNLSWKLGLVHRQVRHQLGVG